MSGKSPASGCITLLSSGNLAVTQAVVSPCCRSTPESDEPPPPVMTAKTMFQVARLVGSAVREVKAIDGDALAANADNF
jgi:putative proteasome-type protease